MKQCPCGSQQPFDNCCGQFIQQNQLPSTAEALMRSRYTAYTLNNIDYIAATMRGKAAEGFDPVSAKQWAESVKWLGLQVLEHEVVSADRAYVEFIAASEYQGQQQELHERSEFHRIDGRWFYVDGVAGTLTPPTQDKVGRNDPCPCGSGHKYKKCCL